MPTDLPAQPWPTIVQGTEPLRDDDDRTQLLVVLCFALSPLAVLLLVFFLTGPERMSLSLECGDTACYGL